ncbi:Pre-mRNA-splicing factor SYF1 [Histomonas meleagridis]|uniref:Pre-mRNA-splicing factor SYF1 n=1 Tax=Histomonas meleagridis TaxID=135588 RepID=UPI00355964CB|nr:Pre-mRNA-splicing factor SYF1 [Histomonas meleagridis]KAH0805561.1 Pre-mRNA-splicing factor SYF1 [Histomonas meleagridis]
MYLNMNGNCSIEELLDSTQKLWIFYERAVADFPRSYKIWIDYCDTRSSYSLQFLSDHEESMRKANGVYERALLNLWTCPRLWLDYLTFLGKQHQVTLLRRTMNRALQSLPITQHDRLWECYLPIVRNLHSISTADDAYRRFLQLHPEHIEDACEYFISEKATKSAAYFLTQLLNDPNFRSLNNRPKFYWWEQLASVIGSDPTVPNAEKLLRDGCKDFIIETGNVWVLIGEHYARLGRFADAIQTFEDALNSTTTAHDFANVFEGASQLLYNIPLHSKSMQMFYAKLEDLLARRPILLNATLIRHDKNNISLWVERTTLYLDHPYEYEPKTRHKLWEQVEQLSEQLGQIKIMEEAIETVEPRKAFDGRYCDLWINLSKLLDDPYIVLEYSLQDESLLKSDIVGIYQYYAELELLNQKETHSREILLNAINDNRIDGAIGSSNLWSFAIDVEWNLGSESSIKELFEKCLKSRSATQRHILAYAQFLEENNHYEEMFRVFERGISSSGWPTCGNLWLRYLYKFISRYKGTRRELTRDLFEDALKDAPKKESFPLYILYAKFEEDYGLIRHAMEIYRRAINQIDDKNEEDMFNTWITSACKLYGVAKSREIYEYAIHKFTDLRAAKWSERYAALETKLTEYERARFIYIHGSQFADPEKCKEFWEKYEQFERLHGTKETFTEMLSQKNLAVARFNRVTNNAEVTEISKEDEDREIAEVDATQEVMNNELKIAETIYDQGKFTAIERMQRKMGLGIRPM